MNRLIILVFSAVLAGCSNLHQPVKAYKETNSQLNNTAIIIATADIGGNRGSVTLADGRTSPIYAYLATVDGVKVSNPPPGVVVRWARVLPGTHRLQISFGMNARIGSTYNAIVTSWDGAIININTPDLLPRHVYLVKYNVVNNSVHARIEDLGENSQIGITNCDFKGDNCKNVVPTF